MLIFQGVWKRIIIYNQIIIPAWDMFPEGIKNVRYLKWRDPKPYFWLVWGGGFFDLT